MFKPFPVSGIARLADENVPGSTARVRNAVMVQPGILKRRTPYTTMRAPFPATGIEFYGLAANSPRSICGVWNARQGFVVRVGDSTSQLSLPATSVLRVGSSFFRGYDDLISAVDLYGGGGVLFGTSPPTVVGNAIGAGARLGGAPRGQDITLSVDLSVGTVAPSAVSPSIGFAPGDAVAYRCVIGYERLNASGAPVEVLGAPGGRFIYSRPVSGTGLNVPKLRVRIPGTIVNYINWSLGSVVPPLNAYIWVYRSALLAGDATKALTAVSSVAPSDEMQLVFKTKLLSADFATGYVEFVDVCPVGAEGPPLYTNPTLGTIAIERQRPPASSSIASFKDTTFYGGVQELVGRTLIVLTGAPHVYTIPTLTSTGASFTFPFAGATAPAITTGMIFSVLKSTGGGITADYVVNGTATLAAGTLTVPVAGAPAALGYTAYYATSARITLNSTLGTPFTLTYDASLNSSPTGTAGLWYIPVTVTAFGGALDVQMKSYVQAIAASLATCINITGVPAYSAGRPTEIVAANNATGTLDTASITVEVVGDSAALINCTFTISGSAYNYYDLASKVLPIQDAVTSIQRNLVQWGPPGIADAICPKYALAIGSPIKEILKLVATKNALYIFKEDGLWILDGDGSGGNNWSLTQVSSDVIALTPSSIDTYEDTVFVATTYGVLMISGSTIVNISQNILSEYSDAIAARRCTDGVNGNGTGGYVVTCSHKEQSVSVSIPTYTGTLLADVDMLFIYSLTTQEWVFDPATTTTPWAGDGNVALQIVRPIRSRLSVVLQQLSVNVLTGVVGAYSVIDILEKRVVRIPDPEAFFVTSLAIESASANAYNEPIGVFSELGSRLPLEEESSFVVAATATGITTVTFPFGMPPSIENLVVGGTVLIDSGGIAHVATSVTWTTVGVGLFGLQLTFAGAPNIFGGGGIGAAPTLYTITPVEVQFSPIGDGVRSYNFNQVGVLQTRRGSTKNMIFSFWLDSTASFPYEAPDVEVVSPIVLRVEPSALIRAGVPARMTRGTRLNVKIATVLALSERFEISKLLSDHIPTSAEETVY